MSVASWASIPAAMTRSLLARRLRRLEIVLKQTAESGLRGTPRLGLSGRRTLGLERGCREVVRRSRSSDISSSRLIKKALSWIQHIFPFAIRYVWGVRLISRTRGPAIPDPDRTLIIPLQTFPRVQITSATCTSTLFDSFPVTPSTLTSLDTVTTRFAQEFQRFTLSRKSAPVDRIHGSTGSPS